MKFLFFLIFIICTNGVYCQDTIVFFDGEKIEAKILEIVTNYIIYRKIDNTKSELITVDNADLNSIILSNGKVFDFTSKCPADFVKDSVTYLGITDAKKYFTGYQKFRPFAILSAAFLTPIIAFYPNYLNANKKINNVIGTNPYTYETSKIKKRNNFYNNTIYKESYKKEAKKFKKIEFG